MLHFAMKATGSRMPAIEALSLFGDRKSARVAKAEVRGNMFGDSRFSPDGRWVAYESDDSGRAEVYVTSFPGGDVTLQISSAGGVYPTWRRDGKELFYLASDGKFMSVDIQPGQIMKAGVPKPLFQMPIPTSYTYFYGRYDVTPDGQRFLVSVPIVNGNSVPLNLVVNWTAGLKKER
jgi:hypothetical protein